MNGFNIKLRTIDDSKNFAIGCPNIFKSKFFWHFFKRNNLFFVRHSVIDMPQSLNFNLLKKTAFLVDRCKNFTIIGLPFFPGGR